MSMCSSARNQFAGTVCALREGDVDYEVRLRLDADNELVAVITRNRPRIFSCIWARSCTRW